MTNKSLTWFSLFQTKQLWLFSREKDLVHIVYNNIFRRLVILSSIIQLIAQSCLQKEKNLAVKVENTH